MKETTGLVERVRQVRAAAQAGVTDPVLNTTGTQQLVQPMGSGSQRGGGAMRNKTAIAAEEEPLTEAEERIVRVLRGFIGLELALRRHDDGDRPSYLMSCDDSGDGLYAWPEGLDEEMISSAENHLAGLQAMNAQTGFRGKALFRPYFPAWAAKVEVARMGS